MHTNANWGTSSIAKYGATSNLAEDNDDKPLAKNDNGKYAAANKMRMITLRTTTISRLPPTIMMTSMLRRAASSRVLKMVIALAQTLPLAVLATGLSSLSMTRG
jgi:hypothetical protein